MQGSFALLGQQAYHLVALGGRRPSVYLTRQDSISSSRFLYRKGLQQAHLRRVSTSCGACLGRPLLLQMMFAIELPITGCYLHFEPLQRTSQGMASFGIKKDAFAQQYHQRLAKS